MERIFAVIPARDEESTIANVIEETRKHVNKVIVVDDGSTDNTSNNSLKADYILKHLVNMGKGVALKTGIEAAIRLKADYIVTVDADGQHDPAEINKLFTALKDEQLDLVVGSRIGKENMPLLYRYGNWFIHKVYKAFFKQNILDTQSGFRVFKSSIYPVIKWNSSSYEVEAEMLANAGRHGLRCKEVPIKTIYANSYKGTTVIDGIKIVLSMVRWRFLR